MDEVRLTQLTDQMWMNLDENFDELVEGIRIVKNVIKTGIEKYEESGDSIDLHIALRMGFVQQACALMLGELAKRTKARLEMDLEN